MTGATSVQEEDAWKTTPNIEGLMEDDTEGMLVMIIPMRGDPELLKSAAMHVYAACMDVQGERCKVSPMTLDVLNMGTEGGKG